MSREVNKIYLIINKRWTHQLDPELKKDKWKEEDLRRLFDFHKLHEGQWKQISDNFPGRTDNCIKNQFFSLIRKSLRRMTKHLKIHKSI